LGLSLTRKLADFHLVSGKAAAGEQIGLPVDQVLLTDTNGNRIPRVTAGAGSEPRGVWRSAQETMGSRGGAWMPAARVAWRELALLFPMRCTR